MAEGAGRGAARADTPLTFLSQQQGLGRNDSAPVFYVMTGAVVCDYRVPTPRGTPYLPSAARVISSSKGFAWALVS